MSDLTDLTVIQYLPMRSLYTDISKHEQEPFLMFGKKYTWTRLNSDYEYDGALRLVRLEPYANEIARRLARVKADIT